MISKELLEQVKFEEGLRLNSYLCSMGKLTIGYGRNIDASPYFCGEKIPHTITKDLAEKILEYDLSHAAQVLAAAWHGYEVLQGARRDACIQMVFQMGLDGFLGFKKMRAALMDGNWQESCDQALDSDWSKQTPARANRVAGQFITGKYYIPK